LKGQLYKCEKFFDKGASELIIHGLGAAVYKACNLALRLKEIHYGTLEFDIKTSTVTLTGKYMFSYVYINLYKFI
jgi:ribonuclease P/MRP protein subunit RPP20